MAIEGELAELLERRKEARAIKTDAGVTLSVLVFHRKGRRVADFKKSWATAVKQAKCPGKLLHDFRRTAARDLIRSGVHETICMRITGHLSRNIFDRYNLTDSADIRKAMSSLAKYRKTQAKRSKVVSMGASR